MNIDVTDKLINEAGHIVDKIKSKVTPGEMIGSTVGKLRNDETMRIHVYAAAAEIIERRAGEIKTNFRNNNIEKTNVQLLAIKIERRCFKKDSIIKKLENLIVSPTLLISTGTKIRYASIMMDPT